MNRVPASAGNNSTAGDSVVVVEADKTFKKLENIVKNASEVIKSVHNLEKERRRLQNGEDLPIQGETTLHKKRVGVWGPTVKRGLHHKLIEHEQTLFELKIN